jgi:ABC-type sugar transport system substrate-binding protein
MDSPMGCRPIDNVQAGRIAGDGLAEAIKAKYGQAQGEVALITAIPGVESLDERVKGFKEESRPNIRAKIRRRQGCRRPGNDRFEHHDRPDHRQT